MGRKFSKTALRRAYEEYKDRDPQERYYDRTTDENKENYRAWLEARERVNNERVAYVAPTTQAAEPNTLAARVNRPQSTTQSISQNIRRESPEDEYNRVSQISIGDYTPHARTSASILHDLKTNNEENKDNAVSAQVRGYRQRLDNLDTSAHGTTYSREEAIAHSEDELSKLSSEDRKKLEEYLKLKEDPRVTGNALGVGIQRSRELVDRTTKLEKELKETYGEDFDRILQYQGYLNDIEETKQLEGNVQRDINEGGFGTRAVYELGDWITNAGAGIAAGAETLKKKLGLYEDSNMPINTYSNLYRMQNINDASYQAMREKAENEGGSIAGPAYTVFHVMGENLANLLIGGAVGGFAADAGVKVSEALREFATLAPFFPAAASEMVKEGQERGLSEEQSLILAGIAGTAEVITEKLPMDNLFKILKKSGTRTAKGIIADVIKQAAEEGGEEVAADVINDIADIIVTGDQSKYNQAVKEYKEQGYSDIDAKKLAAYKFAEEAVVDFTIGGLTGGASAGAATGINYISSSTNARKLFEDGNYREFADSIEDSREAYNSDKAHNLAKQTKELALKLAEKAESGGRISNNERVSLYDHMNEMMSEAREDEKAPEKKETQAQTREQVPAEYRQQATEITEQQALKSFSEAGNASELVKAHNEMQNSSSMSEEAKQRAESAYGLQKQRLISEGKATSEELSEKENTTTPEEAYKAGRSGEEIDLPTPELAKAYNAGKIASIEAASNETVSTKDIKSAEATDLSGERVDVKGLAEENGKLVYVTNKGNMPVSELSLNDAPVQALYGAAISQPSNKYSTAYMEYYPGNIPVNSYTIAFNRFRNAGRLGVASFEDTMKKNGLYVKDLGEKAAREIYNLGQEENKSKDRSKKVSQAKKAEGRVKDNRKNKTSNPVVILAKELADRTGLNITITDELDENIQGEFNAAMSEVILNANSDKMLQTFFHETMGEFLEAYNTEEMKEIQDSVLEWYLDTLDQDKLDSLIEKYQSAYEQAEGEKSFRNAADELVNDALFGLFNSPEGLQEYTEWLYKNRTQTEAKSILQRIADFIKELVESLQNYISDHASMSDASKAAMQMEADRAAGLRARILDAMDTAIENYQNAQEGEANADVRHSVDDDITIEEAEQAEEGEYSEEAENIELSAASQNVQAEDYSYGALVQKPDMIIHGTDNMTGIEYSASLTKADMLAIARKNIEKYNKKNTLGNKHLYNDDLGTVVSIGTKGLKHGPGKVTKNMADAAAFIPSYFQNAIVVNEADGQRNNADKAYIMFGAYKDNEGINLVRIIVNHPRNTNKYEVVEDNLYALKLKKEEADGHLSQPVQPGTTTSSKMKISNFLALVKEYFPNDLSLDVTKKMGKKRGKSDIEGLRYSIDVDSDGQKLSKEQQAFFKDSKVLDENGKLKVVYHGTEAQFTIFDLKEVRDTEDIEAFFFTGDKEESEGYGSNVGKYYLNITNPADYNTAYDIFFKHKGEMGAGAKAREELQRLGYDGVIAEDKDAPEYTEYLAFYPEQIKRTDNKKPTSNPDIRYSLAGINSGTYPFVEERIATELEKDGKTPETIYAATGMFRGADGKWRYEIDDSAATVSGKGDKRLLNNPDYRKMVELENKFFYDLEEGTQEEWEEYGRLSKLLEGATGAPVYLPDIIEHEELFEAYPQLENIKVEFTRDIPGFGRYQDANNKILLKTELKYKGEEKRLKKTLLHEIQHAIQSIEGFAGGANEEMWSGTRVRVGESRLNKAANERMRVFESAPEEAKQIIREYNRAKSDQNYDAMGDAENKLRSEYEEIADAYFDADFKVDLYNDDEELDSFQKYYRTAGEIEARETEKRSDMGMYERKQNMPQITESGDVLFAEGIGSNVFEYRERSDRRRLSVNVDTEGNKLSEGQKEFFKDSKIRDAEGRLRVVYHGTNDTEFNIFDPDYIGSASGDDGFFGRGFYFAYSQGEASYYGSRRIIPAYLNITRPFDFEAELHEYEGEKARYGFAPDAVAFMNFAEKFPEIAKNMTITVAESGSSDTKAIPLAEFAEAFKDVINNKKFEYQTVKNEYGEDETLVLADPKEDTYEYNGKTHTHKYYGFQKRYYNDAPHLDVAYDYLSENVYSYVDMYNFTRAILDNNEDFTDTLKSRGYDGVIQSEEGDEAVAFYPEQIKRTNNLNPTKDPDIRFSLDIDDDLFWAMEHAGSEGDALIKEVMPDYEAEVPYYAMNKAMDSMKTILTSVNNVMKGQKVSESTINKIAEELKDYAKSDIPTKQLADNLYKIFDWMQNSRDVNYEDAIKFIAESVSQVYDYTVDKDTQEYKNYEDLKKYIQSYKAIKLDDLQKKEVTSYYGSWNNFFGQASSIMHINDKGELLDKGIYNEIAAEASKHGVAMPLDAPSPMQPIYIMEALEAIKPEPIDLYGADRVEAATDLAMRVLESYFRAEAESIRHNARSEALSGTEAGKAAQKVLNENIAKLRQQNEKYRESLRKAFDEKLEEKEKKIKKLQEQNKELYDANSAWYQKAKELTEGQIKKQASYEARNKGVAAYKEAQERIRQRKLINRVGMDMINRLISPTDKKHIPDPLQIPVAEFLSGINFISNRAKLNSDNTLKWRDKMNALAQVMDDIAKGKEDLEGLDLASLIDPEIAVRMRDFTKDHEDKVRVSELDSESLKELAKIMRSLSAIMNKSNEFFSNKHYTSIDQCGDVTIREISEKKDLKDYGEVKQALYNIANVDMLEPISYFTEMGTAPRSIYEELRDARDVKTSRIKQTGDYMKKLLKGIDVSTWTGDKATVHEFHISNVGTNDDPTTIKMTEAQIMSLYKSISRQQAKHHIAIGGLTVEDFDTRSGLKKNVYRTKRPVHITPMEYNQIISVLTDEQKHIADEMQNYMATECAKWGNRVTRELYGYSKFTEQDYFPIKVDSNSIATTDRNDRGNESYNAIRNMSASKELTPKANNALVVRDIFDVFSDHVTDMATYEGYCLPLSDALRWFNYKKKTDNKGVTQFSVEGDENNPDKGITIKTTDSVKEQITRVYGEHMKKYFTNLIKDINGEKSGGYSTTLDKFMGNYKAAAVGANLRVVIQQPTAYVRAAYCMDSKYLIRALLETGKARKYSKEAIAKVPLAWWKSQGYYETSLGKSLKEMITGIETLRDKIDDATGKGAQVADDLTWGMIYRAVQLEVEDTKDLKPGTSEFDQAVVERATDIYDQTQVVDTVMNKPQFIRDSRDFVRMATAFMNEPMKSWNMLHRAFISDKVGKTKKMLGKAVAVYVVTNIFVAAAQSFVDAFRNDDDETPWIERFLDAMFGYSTVMQEDADLKKKAKAVAFANLGDDLNPLNLFPYFKEISSMMQGYDSSRMDTAWMTSIYRAIKATSELITGEGKKTPYGVFKADARAISQMTGLPIYNVMREIETIYNNISDTNLNTSMSSEYGYVYDAIKSGKDIEVETVKLRDKKIDKYLSEGVSQEEAEKKTRQYMSSAITSKYKDQLISLYESDKAAAGEMKQKLIQAYVGCGLTREEANDKINKWIE